MAMIKGETVILHQRKQIGVDAFGAPQYIDSTVAVDNVLVGTPSTDDITNSVNLYGKRLAYVIGIPKGDSHNWTDTIVEFFGQKFKTYGFPVRGTTENIPLDWDQNVMVERYG